MARGTSSRRGSGAGNFSVLDAAELAEASYHPDNYTVTKGRITKRLNQDHVTAHMLSDGILLVPGSDSVWDYAKYNLRPFRIGGKKYTLSSGDTGKALGGFWHQGFLAHAQVVFDSFKSTPPRMIIGHSMGAASAQILSLLWDVPSIGFAAPRVFLGYAAVPAQPLNLSIYRADDIVGWLPGEKFSHAGKSVKLNIASGLPRHKMRHYRSVLTNSAISSDVPQTWRMG